MTIGHEAEVADAMKAVGQGMKEKTTDELVWLQPHDLLGAVLAVILPSEGDVSVIPKTPKPQLINSQIYFQNVFKNLFVQMRKFSVSSVRIFNIKTLALQRPLSIRTRQLLRLTVLSQH